MSQAASVYPINARRRHYDRSILLQKYGTAVGGSALAIYGLTRRSALGYVLAAGAGTMAYYAVRANPKRQVLARSTVQINCSPEEAYRFWRDFENLPRFMRHLESVSNIGDRRTRWIAIGPLGRRVHWDAEITQERTNDLIAWHSLPNSEIHVDGRVQFRPASGDRGTILDVAIIYDTPGGPLGRYFAKLLGKNPSFLMRQDLRRFKALVETGEIPTTEGQSHGPRDRMTAAFRVINPDAPMPRGAKITEVLSANRRVS